MREPYKGADGKWHVAGVKGWFNTRAEAQRAYDKIEDEVGDYDDSALEDGPPRDFGDL